MLLQQSKKKSLVAAHQKKKWNNKKKKRKREDIDMQVDGKLSSHSRRDVNTTNGNGNGNGGDKVTSNSTTEGNSKQQVNNGHQRKNNNGRRNRRYNKKSTTNNHHHGLNNGGGGGDNTSNKKKQQSIVQNKRSTQNNKPTLKNNVPPTLQGPQSSAQQSSRSSKQHGECSQPTKNDNHQSSAATTGKKKKSNNNSNKTRIVECIAEKSLLQMIRQNNPSVVSGVKEGEGNDNEAAEGIRSNGNNGNDHANEQLLLDMPKDMINDLPQYQPRKKIVVITNATQSNAAVALLRKELLYDYQQNKSNSNTNNGNDDANNYSSFQYLGFDTETKPKYHKGGTGNPPALLQLATSSTAYLFRLVIDSASSPNNKNTVMTSSLLDLLSDTSIIKIGVGIHKDVIELQSIYGPECCGGSGSSLLDNDNATSTSSSYLDLTTLVKARYPKLQRTGLRNLTATVLQYRLAKSQQMSNWEQVYYSRAMEVYAAADALVALDLLDAILA